MKHIYLNLKRFDISPGRGGVNHLADMSRWGAEIVSRTQDDLAQYDPTEVEFVQYFPEAHLLPAMQARGEGSPVGIGCQSVYRGDTAVGGAFGAFTSNRTANAAAELGCVSTLIGHCEERADKLDLLARAGVDPVLAAKTVNRILNEQIKAAQAAGLSVLYCIGEKSEEQDHWQTVLGQQLSVGLDGVDRKRVVVAYEPLWSIGPGKTPADRPYIEKVAAFIKEQVSGIDVVYGGGLKKDNAAMLAGIENIDGGLIALTRFSGEIGFYPEEYLEIIHLYMQKGGTQQ